MSIIEELQQELAALRSEVAQLRAHTLAQVTAEPGNKILSRRNLLRAAPVAAIGAGIAAMSATSAAAAAGQPILLAGTNAAGAGKTTTVTGGTSRVIDNHGVAAGAPAAVAVVGGVSTDWANVSGVAIASDATAQLVVQGDYQQAYAATFQGGPVGGNHTSEGADAVLISATGPGTGLIVSVGDGEFFNPSDPTGASDEHFPAAGIQVTSQAGAALTATSSEQVASFASTDVAATVDGVVVTHAGKGRALRADSTLAANVNGSLTGVHHGNGPGVWGENSNTTSTSGIGVVGVGNAKGRGGRFAGGQANIQLTPGTATTHPSFVGHAGDLFVDSTARLWYCTKTNTSTLASTWKQIA
jgi:hypothetical protein